MAPKRKINRKTADTSLQKKSRKLAHKEARSQVREFASSKSSPKRAKSTAMNAAASKLHDRLRAAYKNYTPPPLPPGNFTDGKPGIYENIPFEAYASLDAVNFSSLKALDHSPAKYQAQDLRTSDDPTVEPDYLRLGNLIHCAILEPDELLSRYIVLPDLASKVGPDPKTGKPYKAPKQTARYKELVSEFLSLHPGKIQATQEDFNTISGIARRIRNHPWIKSHLSDSISELTLVWKDLELPLLYKARLDAVNLSTGVYFDLKTTTDVTQFDIGKFNYHQQAAFYAWGFQELSGQWLSPHIGAVEKLPPYSFRIAPLSHKALEVAYMELRQKLELLSKCRQSRRYPHPADPPSWDLPPWYRPYVPNV